MPRFQFGTTPIEYEIEYQSGKKDVAISVEWLDGVRVSAPEDISQERLEATLHQKAPWIMDQWRQLNEVREPAPSKEFISGEKFPYLGRHYRLKVYRTTTDQTTLAFQNGRFIAEVPETMDDETYKQQLHDHFKHFYITRGTNKAKARVAIYAEKMAVTPSIVILKEQKMRWGACGKNGEILLNWRLMMAPVSVLDYVIVHEMAHLRHPNHSKAFWQTVHSVLPDYERRKEWLRINGPRLRLG